MAVGLLSHEVSDLCIGKPALRSLPLSASVADALRSLKRCGETHLAVWRERSPPSAPPSERRAVSAAVATCLGKVCMVDVICYLCSEENLESPAAALRSPVSALLPKDPGVVIRQVDPHSSVLEAVDVLLGGAQNLMVPLRASGGSGRNNNNNNSNKMQMQQKNGGVVGCCCWLTQEDFVRFFLNSIGVFSPISALSVDELGVVRPDVLALRYHEPALSAVPLIRAALASQTAVAVVTDDGKLIGEISPSTLANCDETVAAAIATLSAGELMAYIDSGGLGGPPEEAVRAVKARLRERGLHGMLELVEDAASTVSSPSSAGTTTSSGSSSSSSDEESPAGGGRRRGAARYSRSGSYSARMGRRSEDAIVCHPWSSLLAVMIQALAHRVSYVWVVDDEYQLAGVVTFPDVLTVFREQLQSFDQ